MKSEIEKVLEDLTKRVREHPDKFSVTELAATWIPKMNDALVDPRLKAFHEKAFEEPCHVIFYNHAKVINGKGDISVKDMQIRGPHHLIRIPWATFERES